MDGILVPRRGHVVLSDGPDARGFRAGIGPSMGMVPGVKETNGKGPVIG